MDTDWIPLSVPFLGGKEWDYVRECLDTGWVSSAGSYVDRLEQEMVKLSAQPAAVATVSGTAALHLGLEIVGVEAEDEVLVSDLTFVAPLHAIRYRGAHPILVDCNPQTLQMEVDLVRDFLLRECRKNQDGRLVNRATGRRVAAVVPVHLLGHPVDMDPLLEVCQQVGLAVVEDATESLGALYRGRPVGSHGQVACYSFNGNKIVTGGGGGCLVTERSLAERARYLSTQAKDDPFYFVHHSVGYNYRLSNLQAAMVVAQLEQLDEFVGHKRALAQAYQDSFADLQDIEVFHEQTGIYSTHWLFTIALKGKARDQRDALLQHLQDHRIQARPLWNPNHKNPPYRNCQLLCSGVSQASDIVDRALCLPSSVRLSRQQQAKVCEVVRDFVKARG